MKSRPFLAIVVLGVTGACSNQQATGQRPAGPPPVPAKTAAATTAPVEAATTTPITPTPGIMVVNDYDPPMRVPISR